MTGSLHNLLSRYALPLGIALLALLVAAGGNEAKDALRYDRLAIVSGQGWRVFSAHFAHLGWAHLWMNLAGLALVWILVGNTLSWQRWLAVFLCSCLGVSLGLLAFNPELRWYVGLSGVLHGLLCAGSIMGIRQGDGRSWPLLILVWGKLIWEQLAGPLPGSAATAGGAVIVDAHFYGALAGTLICSFFSDRVRPGEGAHR